MVTRRVARWADQRLGGANFARTALGTVAPYMPEWRSVVLVVRLTWYSRRAPSPPGVWTGAVTGLGCMPEPVRPMSGIRFQRTDGPPTAFVKWSASIET